MKILVTGANGLLGQTLVTFIDADSTVELIATARSPLLPTLNRGVFETLDITCYERTHKLLKSICPDVVVHVAAMTNVDDCEQHRERCWQVNVEATKHWAAICKDINAHLIYLSTDFVFEGLHNDVLEYAPTLPVNYYGKSKLRAEQIITKVDMRATIVRTALVYGSIIGDKQSNIVLWAKKKLLQRKRLHMLTDQWRTPTFVKDLAEGCITIAKNNFVGTYHIAGSEIHTPYDVVKQTAQVFDLDKSLIYVADAQTFSQLAPRPVKTGLNIDKAKKELSYRPSTLLEGLYAMKMHEKDSL